jgi:hypothetical protein
MHNGRKYFYALKIICPAQLYDARNRVDSHLVITKRGANVRDLHPAANRFIDVIRLLKTLHTNIAEPFRRSFLISTLLVLMWSHLAIRMPNPTEKRASGAECQLFNASLPRDPGPKHVRLCSGVLIIVINVAELISWP